MRTLKSTHWIAGVSIALLALQPSVAFADTFLRDDINPTLGQGYDTITGRLRQVCVAPTAAKVETPIAAGGYQIRHVTDSYQLSTLTQVGLSFAYKAVSGSGDGSLSWFENKSLSTFVETFLVQGTFTKAEVSQKFRLLPQYRTMRDANILQFRKVCGDAFVTSYKTGALIQGAITIKTRSETEQQRLQADAGVNTAGGNANANSLTELVKKSDSRALSIDGRTIGLGRAFPGKGEALIAEALNIAPLATARPSLPRVGFSTSDYDIFGSASQSVNANLRTDALLKLARDFASLSRLQADLQYLHDNSSEFGPFVNDTFNQRLKQLNVEQGKLWESSRGCIERRNIANCQQILARTPIQALPFHQTKVQDINPTFANPQPVCTLRQGEYARVTGAGGWWVGARRDSLQYFRDIVNGVANVLTVSSNPAIRDLSSPRMIGPGGDVSLTIRDDAPADNERGPQGASVTCAFLPFAEDSKKIQ